MLFYQVLLFPRWIQLIQRNLSSHVDYQDAVCCQGGGGGGSGHPERGKHPNTHETMYQSSFNPYNTEIFFFKPWRPMGFF